MSVKNPTNDKNRKANTAQRTNARRNKRDHEWLRSRLKGGPTILAMERHVKAITDSLDPEGPAMDFEELEKRKYLIDTCLKKLRFIIPTLKAVELKGDTGPREIIIRLPDID